MMNYIFKKIWWAWLKFFEMGVVFQVGVAKWAKRVFCSPGCADSKNICDWSEIQLAPHLQSGRQFNSHITRLLTLNKD